MKNQSAMEYLMTYGWAILVIAVVLAALFQLGVFNPSNLSPRAQPGGCSVKRSTDVGFGSSATLAGLCSGQEPKYVAQFNGQNSNINAGSASDLYVTNTVTISAWINPDSLYSNSYFGLKNFIVFEEYGGASDINYGLQITDPTSISFVKRTSAEGIQYYTFTSIPSVLNKWTYVVLSATGGVAKLYVNGTPAGTPQSINLYGFSPTSGQIFIIGGWGSSPTSFSGQIANIQIYNSSLSANEIATLYKEGIGAPPIALNHLIGWWPLNNNPTDYSGNGNDGTATGITYTSDWPGGYVQPK